jgi:ribose 5-phosphate isomerase A
MKLNPVLRLKDGKPFITDNKNYIIDLHLKAPLDIKKLKGLKNLLGVVETGLFLNMCDRIIVGSDKAFVFENENKK